MTYQIPDRLIYNGVKHELEHDLLNDYLRQINVRPQNAGNASCLWKGYVALFEVRDFDLYLKDLGLMQDEEQELFIKQAFPLGLPLKLDFISQLIILYNNKLEGTSIAAYNVYKTYEVLEITNGTLTDFKILNHVEMQEFKLRQYDGFLTSDAYRIKKKARINYLKGLNEKPGKYKPKKMEFDEEEFKKEIKSDILYHTKHFY